MPAGPRRAHPGALRRSRADPDPDAGRPRSGRHRVRHGAEDRAGTQPRRRRRSAPSDPSPVPRTWRCARSSTSRSRRSAPRRWISSIASPWWTCSRPSSRSASTRSTWSSITIRSSAPSMPGSRTCDRRTAPRPRSSSSTCGRSTSRSRSVWPRHCVYGIKADTLGLERGGSKADLEAFAFVYMLANHNALRRIERPELSDVALDLLANGLAKRQILKGVFFSHLGDGADGGSDPALRGLRPAGRRRGMVGRLRRGGRATSTSPCATSAT